MVNALAVGVTEFCGEDRTSPEIVCVPEWSGVCASATIWLMFFLYAAVQGLG